MPELRSSGARSSNDIVQGPRNRSIYGAVAAAAIPAVAISGMAAAAPAVAAEVPTTRALLLPKPATSVNIAAAQQRIAAHLVASHIPARLTVATAAPKTVTVKSGDTLSGIAHRHHVSLSTLLKANHLSVNDLIFPGQKLKLATSHGSAKQSSSRSSSSASKATSYTIKSGDTLSGIAHKHHLSLSELLKSSGLKASTTIYPGQKIRLSGGSSAPAKSSSASKTTAKSSPGTGATYTVKSGDTLSGIASKAGVGLSSVLKANNLSRSSVIYPGQKIRLSGGSPTPVRVATSSAKQSKPSATPRTSSYTVKSGDTLSGIASKAGVGLSSLLKANNLSRSSVIYPGQKIRLSGGSAAPAKSTSAPKAKTSTYTVKSGDTLSGIAAEAGMGLSKLLEANHLSKSSVIRVGQKLKVGAGASVSATSSRKQLVSDTFLHYKYPSETVKSANDNKYELLSRNLPSRAEMKSLIVSTARQMGVDPSLALAHAYQESGFNMAAVSPANAIGAMQVIPTSGEWASQLVGRKLDLLNPRDNVTAGVAIIRSLQRTSSSVEVGIASYYQGQGSVKRNGMYTDTKAYVRSVKAHQKTFS
ncbi:LysM peptidoglycan-binding domain-containing protein [Arthrobacter sp.]|uniref:LysM peptidoglycan-binding domain-containing protein n=1 Tax=Arthrobacter sp. TaxID=1667 RepID=UPI003A9069E3